MFNPKKLLEMTRRRHKVTAAQRRRRNSSSTDVGADSTASSVVEEGHFVVYAMDGVRFVVPLPCLDSPIFVELFRMAEEEFGFPGNGPIVLPCTESVLEYAVSLIQRSVTKDVEKAFATAKMSYSDGKSR
ncbi:hypothetical protein ACLOJK_002314 [Asimina triloba]